eukprot:14133780-Ditylum_brightwellii.AAC.1
MTVSNDKNFHCKTSCYDGNDDGPSKPLSKVEWNEGSAEKHSNLYNRSLLSNEEPVIYGAN